MYKMYNISISLYIYNYTGFSLMGEWGVSPPPYTHTHTHTNTDTYTSQIWLIHPAPPLCTNFVFWPHQKPIQPNKTMTLFLAAVIAPAPFLF